MRRWKITGLIAVLFLLVGCSGLPVAREMGDMALMRTLGVDSGTADGIVLTASTGERTKGLQRQVVPPLILSAEHSSISGASLALQGLSDRYIFYGYVDQLLVGQELAEGGMVAVLDYFAHNIELGLGTEVWMIAGDAGDAILSGGDVGVDGRLSTLHADSKIGAAGITRTAGQTLTDILEQGATYLPVLKVGEGENPTLLEYGYGLFQGDKWVGTLTGEMARGLELLESATATHITQLTTEGTTVALRQETAHTAITPKFDGSQLVGVSIHCEIVADLAEFQVEPSGEELELLCAQLGAMEQERMDSAIGQMQTLNVDALGFGSAIGIRAPQHWGRLEGEWQTLFETIPITVAVDVTIRRTK